jgi:hypothetical protein
MRQSLPPILHLAGGNYRDGQNYFGPANQKELRSLRATIVVQ